MNSSQNCGTNKKEIIRYFLGDKFPDLYLGRREAECVALLLDGLSTEETAAILHLAPSTIEFYFTNIKRKLSCRYKKEIVEIVKNSDFVNHLDKIKNNLIELCAE